MKPQVTLTITSLLSILLFSLHWADEIARGMEPGTVSAFGGRIAANSSGVLFWVWTNIALGASGMLSFVLSACGLWSLQRGRPTTPRTWRS